MTANATPRGLREWGKHFLIYGAGIIALNALSFLLIPIYTHRIGPGEYGTLELLNRAQDLTAIVVMSGLAVAALAFHQFEAGTPERQRKVFATASFGILANATILIAALFPFSSGIAEAVLGSSSLAWAVRMYLFIMPLEVIFQIGLVSLQAEFRSTAYVLTAVGRFLYGLALNLTLVLWLRHGLQGIITANLLQTAVPALLLAAYMVVRSRGRVEWRLLFSMLKYGAPFIPGGFFLFVLNSGDRYFLKAFYSSDVVGLYGLAYKLSSIVVFLVLTPFLKLWGPSMVEVSRSLGGATKIARINTYLCAAYLYVGLLIALIAPALLRWFTAPKYWGAAATIPLLIAAYLFWTISIVADTVFYVEKKTWVKPLILGAACLVSLSAYAILIPRFAAMGAAIATLVSFAFFAWLTVRVGNRYVRVPYEVGRLAVLCAGTAAVYLAGRWLSAVLVPDWLVTLTAAIVLPVALFWTSFLRKDEKAGVERVRVRLSSLMSSRAA